MSYDKIIDRLTAAKAKCARLEADCVALEDAIQEYTRAWDMAGAIWNAAEAAEEVADMDEAARLWSLLVPFDDEAETRLREIS